MNCVFCKIIAGELPSTTVIEWPDTVAIRPLNPVTDGHVLFIPTEHVTAAHEDPAVTAQVASRAAEWARAAQLAAINDGGPTAEYNLITSCGPAATQSISHLHIHYVPRRTGDGLPLPWTGQTKENDQ